MTKSLLLAQTCDWDLVRIPKYWNSWWAWRKARISPPYKAKAPCGKDGERAKQGQ